MPLKLSFRLRADRDLDEILNYISEQNGDDEIAKRFGERLFAKCEELTRAPGMGSPYRGRPQFRKVNEGPYKIFYRAYPQKVVIFRIWDGRRGSDPKL
jgi:plasmid stabilization system protein ParE